MLSDVKAFMKNVVSKLKVSFKNADELSRVSVKCFGVQFNKHSLYAVCSGYSNSYYGFKFKYITKEEYLQYKMINNDEVV